MNVAVTGSSGFVGRNLVSRLERDGFNIIQLDLNNHIDLCDWSTLQSIPDFSILYHLAAKSFVPDSYKEPRAFYTTNLISTLNSLELCRMHNACFVLLSSYVYGAPLYLPIDEIHPTTAANPYMNSKLMCESLCSSYHRDFDIKVIIFRPFNIYGYGQSSQFLIPHIISQIGTGKIRLKDPRPKRDFLHVIDVVDALAKILNHSEIEFGIYNLGSGVSYSIQDIVSIITGMANVDVKVEYDMDFRKDEILNTVADIRKIGTELGWKPQISFEEGLTDLLTQI